MFRYSPFDQMFNMFRDFDALFRRSLSDLARFETPGLPGPSTRALTTGTGDATTPWEQRLLPSVESFTRDDRLVFRAEIPGVDPSELEVSLVGDLLTVRGEKKLDRKVEEDRLHFQEIAHGRFERSFRVPADLKPKDVKASYQNGVLEVSVPMPAAAKTHRIPVSGGSERKRIKAA